jgi:precorrin-6Y C5,15-methyltransferase (decarboxylating)
MAAPEDIARELAGNPIVTAARTLVGPGKILERLDWHPGEKIAAGPDIPNLCARIKSASGRVVVLCSGDPLFFSLGASVASFLKPRKVRIIPNLSSLQTACACLGFPWEDTRSVSLHGRSDLLPLAHALMSGRRVFLLTDERTDPQKLSAWMLERGYSAYRLHILDGLHHDPDFGAQARRRQTFSVAAAALGKAAPPRYPGQRAILLEPTKPPVSRPFGLDDALLSKAGGMFSKAPVRAAGMAALGVEPGHTVWDLGAGSGATALEAARLAWEGQVFAVERKPDRLRAIADNRKKFRAANLEIIAMDLPFSRSAGVTLPPPDRVFIGGGLSGPQQAAREIIVDAYSALNPGGRLLAHCILLSSLELTRGVLKDLGAKTRVMTFQASEGRTLAADLRLEALNPVFLVLGEKNHV